LEGGVVVVSDSSAWRVSAEDTVPRFEVSIANGDEIAGFNPLFKTMKREVEVDWFLAEFAIPFLAFIEAPNVTQAVIVRQFILLCNHRETRPEEREEETVPLQVF